MSWLNRELGFRVFGTLRNSVNNNRFFHFSCDAREYNL